MSRVHTHTHAHSRIRSTNKLCCSRRPQIPGRGYEKFLPAVSIDIINLSAPCHHRSNVQHQTTSMHEVSNDSQWYIRFTRRTSMIRLQINPRYFLVNLVYFYFVCFCYYCMLYFQLLKQFRIHLFPNENDVGFANLSYQEFHGKSTNVSKTERKMWRHLL